VKYDIVHSTRYVYHEVATLCHNQAHLIPRESARQRPIQCQLEITPTPCTRRPWSDVFGNLATYFTIEQSHRELHVTARSQVEVNGPSVAPADCSMPWEQAVTELDNFYRSPEYDSCVLICRSSRINESNDVRDYALQSFQPGRTLFEVAMELTARIHTDFRYDPLATSIATPADEILRCRRGVCQDFAHLQVACLRLMGLSARYVSGYLVTRPPPGKAKLVGADATHAWVSVFFPGHGWIDFDPTNNRLATSDYVTLAWGRDYADVSPVRGVFLGGGAHLMTVSVDVAPVSSN
jgi:transglutaminase-like putative cysteine protease